MDTTSNLAALIRHREEEELYVCVCAWVCTRACLFERRQKEREYRAAAEAESLV